MLKITAIGNLTRDPETKTITSGAQYCKFDIASNRTVKGEKVTDYITCFAWNKTAELCAKYLAKGRKVGICGNLISDEWTASDGSKRKGFHIEIDNIEFLSSAEKTETPKQSIDDIDEVSGDDMPF